MSEIRTMCRCVSCDNYTQVEGNTFMSWTCQHCGAEHITDQPGTRGRLLFKGEYRQVSALSITGYPTRDDDKALIQKIEKMFSAAVDTELLGDFLSLAQDGIEYREMKDAMRRREMKNSFYKTPGGGAAGG